MDHATRRQQERLRGSSVLGPALIASVLLHVAAFHFISFRIDFDPATVRLPAPRVVEIAPIMHAYDLLVADDDPSAADAFALPLAMQEPPDETDPPEGVREAAQGVADTRTADSAPPPAVRERLQYRLGRNADVWQRPPPALPGELTPAERVDQRIASRLGEYNDSVAAEAEARARALDWTTTDAEGRRWGISPGQIHLGSVTLPLPFALASTPEAVARVGTWNEIQAQAAREQGRGVFNDRVKAIRARIDAERRAKMAGDTIRRPPAGGG